MPDAVEAAWQHMQEKAPDELMRVERHGLVTLWPLDAVVLVFEGDAIRIGRDQAAVGDGDAMGVAGEIGQDRLRPGKRFFRVDAPNAMRSTAVQMAAVPFRENGYPLHSPAEG